MKKVLVVILMLLSFTVQAQKINSENYYDHFSIGRGLKGNKLTTAWLTEFDVAQILKEEMEKAGLEWISQFRIVKLGEKEYVTSICFSEKSSFGFLYESSHSAIPKVTDRDVVSMYKTMTGNDYAEKVVSLNGDSDFIKIKEVPKGLYIIKENPYWYQFTNHKGDDAVLVTREIIIEILRSDIRKVLADRLK